MAAARRERAIAVRPAAAAEVGALNSLIAASARGLGHGFYSEQQTEAAVAHVFGVDSELVADGTYLVATIGGRIVGCGGWSRRATLFGGDGFAGRSAGTLDLGGVAVPFVPMEKSLVAETTHSTEVLTYYACC